MTDSNAESEAAGQTDYPFRGVRILVDEPARSDRDRGPRIFNTEKLAEQDARMMALPQEAICETNEPLPTPPLAAPSPDSSEVLLDAAKALHAARKQFVHIGDRIAELSQKSRELDKLKAAVADARAQRTTLLADALLAGKIANTRKADERHVAAVAALEKRQDEITAVERALETLQAQREDARSALTERERVYQAARDEDLVVIKRVRSLTVKFHEAIAEARANLEKMPAQFRERVLSAKVDLEAEQLPPVDVLLEVTTSPALANLIEAEKLAAIPPEPLPKCLGYVWSDGFARPNPEPMPESPPPVAAGLVRSET